MKNGDPSLRFEKCGVKDLDQLVQISRTTFDIAFRAVNDPINFEDYLNKAFHPETLKQQLAHEDTEFYFAYLKNPSSAVWKNTPVGYLKINVGNAQTEPMGDSTLELERIYVVSEFQGRKLGSVMLGFVEELALATITRRKSSLKAKEAGKSIWLGVWEENRAATRFYERHGFHRFGTHSYWVGTDEQTDILLKKALVSCQGYCVG